MEAAEALAGDARGASPPTRTRTTAADAPGPPRFAARYGQRPVLTSLDLVWRAPGRSRDVLRLMIVLNTLWAVTDLVYIPLLGLAEVDFYAKLAVNAALAIGLAVAGRRAGIV